MELARMDVQQTAPLPPAVLRASTITMATVPRVNRVTSKFLHFYFINQYTP